MHRIATLLAGCVLAGALGVPAPAAAAVQAPVPRPVPGTCQPEAPQVPKAPGAPKVPRVPKALGAPKAPDVPKAPGLPKTPELPKTPDSKLLKACPSETRAGQAPGNRLSGGCPEQVARVFGARVPRGGPARGAW